MLHLHAIADDRGDVLSQIRATADVLSHRLATEKVHNLADDLIRSSVTFSSVARLKSERICRTTSPASLPSRTIRQQPPAPSSNSPVRPITSGGRRDHSQNRGERLIDFMRNRSRGSPTVAVCAARDSRVSVRRRASSAFFRSSMSVDDMYQLRTRPSVSRKGRPRQ